MPFNHPSFQPLAHPEAIVQSGNARFTVLSPRIIRLEYDAEQRFEDRASQVFWYRAQPVPEFKVWEENGWLHIETDQLYLSYKLNGEFFWRDLNIVLKESGVEWQFGSPDHLNLKGTARTLDRADGPIPLGDGLVSRSGSSVIDDSKSLVFNEANWLIPREANAFKRDLYFFGYGNHYLEAVQDFQALSGKPSLLPRWALGNWWSRFWPYTQQDLTDLMLEFKARRIPLSVCIVDMDWHITKTGNNSSGWTGYTWNRALFPDPDAFIAFLHAQKLRTALNLHPAEGIHPHEAVYPQLAEALGVDPETKKAIEFDIASEAFTKGYLELIHHPMEEAGVDFWWLDWQQGTRTKTPGLDPLFWLNHLHYYDLGRTPSKRPFVFSRWPGLGGQRYPIGFSGDSIVSWESLAFQPYFTATASNVAFGWWSHDIGGHCEGVENDELYLRWVQYGIFSPIFRLHATNNPYCERLPWKHGLDNEAAAREAMQLRHSLIPLLYTAAHENSQSGEPPVLPLYYSWPIEAAAYASPQAYLFCGQILAAPFTSPTEPTTELARQALWLPKGDWFNFFTGEYLQGNSWTAIYGGKDEIPAFIQSGAIIPLNQDSVSNGADLPRGFLVRAAAGKPSHFTLYEDDGFSQAYLKGEFANTEISQGFEDDAWHFRVQAPSGSLGFLPEERSWQLEVYGLSEPSQLVCRIAGNAFNPASQYDKVNGILRVDFGEVKIKESIELTAIGAKPHLEEMPILQRIERIMARAQVPSIVKQQFFMDLPELLANPKKFLAMANKFTEAQLLSIYESVFNHQAAPIPQDRAQAFANMMNTFYTLLRS